MLGKSIQVVMADHQNKADIAAGKAREWFDTRQVDMISDLGNSSTALAVTEVGKQKNRIVIVNGAASTKLSNENCTPDRRGSPVSDSAGQAKAKPHVFKAGQGLLFAAGAPLEEEVFGAATVVVELDSLRCPARLPCQAARPQPAGVLSGVREVDQP